MSRRAPLGLLATALIVAGVAARLETAAQLHARDMVERQFFAHDTPEGLGPADRALNSAFAVSFGGPPLPAGAP